MPTIDDWTFDKQLVWSEVLGGTTIMSRHPTYPAEDTWHDDQGPAALQSIAVKYLRKVTGPVDRKGTGALDLPELFDEEGTFKVPLAWLPVEVSETPSPRSSYLLTRYAQPLAASDVLDRTAVLMAVESTEAKKEQPLGSRLGIKVFAHISRLDANNVRITGASCSAGLADAIGPHREGPFARLITTFFTSFFTDAEYQRDLEMSILEAAGLRRDETTWIEGVRIRRNSTEGAWLDVFLNVPNSTSDPLGVAQAVTGTITIAPGEKIPFVVEEAESFPLVADAGPVKARLFRLDPGSQRRFRHLVDARPSRAPGRLQRFRHAQRLPGLTLDGYGNVHLLDDLGQVEVMRSKLVARRADETKEQVVHHPSAVPHARTNAFAALSAYRRARRLFDTMRAYGLSPAQYFKFADWPLRVRYRAPIQPGPGKDGKTINAQVSYDPPGCSIIAGSWAPATRRPLQVRFALADLRRSWSRRQPLGLATDPRWSWHEYSHVLLAASTGALELLFAHSAGDALAAITSDPRSKIFHATPPNQQMRGATFPWVYLHRRHDRSVYDGWSWSGRFHRPARFPHDGNNCRHKGYQSEQILSTSLFRLYRALGGDTVRANGKPATRARRGAADYSVYLVMRAIGLLGPSMWAPAETPDQLVSALVDADIATWPASSGPLEDRVGGWSHKVIRWAFEAQGLYATTDPLDVVDAPGNPPDVDVFIDDLRPDFHGRVCRGGYTPVSLDLHSARWQARPDTVVVEGDHVSVYVRNRGATAASDTVVQVWWIDWSGGTPIPKWYAPDWNSLGASGAQSVPPWPEPPLKFGPFSGLPSAPSGRRLLILAAATCPADRANNDPITGLPCALVPTPIVDLAAGDNNLGLRIYTIP